MDMGQGDITLPCPWWAKPKQMRSLLFEPFTAAHYRRG